MQHYVRQSLCAPKIRGSHCVTRNPWQSLCAFKIRGSTAYVTQWHTDHTDQEQGQDGTLQASCCSHNHLYLYSWVNVQKKAFLCTPACIC